MATPAQENTGPKTAPGKATASRNPLKRNVGSPPYGSAQNTAAAAAHHPHRMKIRCYNTRFTERTQKPFVFNGGTYGRSEFSKRIIYGGLALNPRE